MVSLFRRQRLNLPLVRLSLPAAQIAGIGIGVLVAFVFALMPTTMLEDLMIDTGIASVVAAAAPPLGYTARFALIFLFGGAVGVLSWFACYLMFGHRLVAFQQSRDEDTDRAPVLRRADAHPDAPARRPLSAIRDLGAPFFEPSAERRASDEDGDTALAPDAFTAPVAAAREPRVIAAPAPVEQPIPADLNQPLAAFDPAAISDDPKHWHPAPAPLSVAPTTRRPTYEPSERFETFDLEHTARKVPPKPALAQTKDPSASIHALLDRLERGVGRHEPAMAVPAFPPMMQTVAEVTPTPAPAPRAESIEDALASLRKLAARG